jgi:hypothetical protein
MIASFDERREKIIRGLGRGWICAEIDRLTAPTK